MRPHQGQTFYKIKANPECTMQGLKDPVCYDVIHPEVVSQVALYER